MDPFEKAKGGVVSKLQDMVSRGMGDLTRQLNEMIGDPANANKNVFVARTKAVVQIKGKPVVEFAIRVRLGSE